MSGIQDSYLPILDSNGKRVKGDKVDNFRYIIVTGL